MGEGEGGSGGGLEAGKQMGVGSCVRRVPSQERPMSLGAFLSGIQGKVQVSGGFNYFLSEEVIPFYANTSVEKFVYRVNVPLGEI